jgi:hypothetical protein
MSIAEIEDAVDHLDEAAKRKLLLHLQAALNKAPTVSLSDRQRWVKELEAFARSISTGKQVMSSEDILAELRED